ncbi:MAG: hypothetical protein QXM31_01575 [Candidatus Woesearchaeota archaeon]
MDNHFMEYLIPVLYDEPPNYCHFFENRIRQICNEERFTYSQKPIPGMAPAVSIEAFSSTATKTFGMRYEIKYSPIRGKPQIISREIILNRKTVPKAPGRFRERLEQLDARISRLFPDEPIILEKSA